MNLNPSMSGDGRIVAFESTEGIAGAGGVERFRAIRANISVDPPTFQQLAATRAPAPAISQDGSRIVFASKDDPLGTNHDGNSEIFLHDGAKLIQITNTAPGDVANRTISGNFLPSISDDGRFIAFSSNRDLTNQNVDNSLEIFVYDTVVAGFTQLTNASGIVGFTDAKISGNAVNVAYIRDSGVTPSAKRDLLLQNRAGPPSVRVLALAAPALAMTYGRAISDDGLRVVWAAETAEDSSQVFLYDGRNSITQQVTSLGVRSTDVPFHATISGDGSRITFATRRNFLGNSDGSVDLYSYDIPSSTFGRVTSGPSNATAEVLSSMNDDGSIVAFNYPRVLTGISNNDFANTSEIYVTGTPVRPAFGTLTILNGASFGLEPSSINAVAPGSIAVARGSALAFITEQSERLPDGTFPRTVGGTTVTVNGRHAQLFFVSPSQVNFLVPPETELGIAQVIVTNSDGFPSHGAVVTLRAAPGVFSFSGDGLGEGVILNADTMKAGPFDPTNGDLRLIIFSTGVGNGLLVSVTAGGRALTTESIMSSPDLPGLDEIHVLVPADLRGAGTIDLVVRDDARESNPVAVMFGGDARRDITINEFLADPPGASASALEGDANHDGERNTSEDEFIELVNSTTRDIDISGYQILTRGGTGSSDILRHTFTAGTILRSCTAIVVFGGGSPNPDDPIFGGSKVMTASPGPLTLNNSSGVITLLDQAGTIASFLAYGRSTGLDADDNQSLTRSPEITGAFTKHLLTSGGAAFSPGTQSTSAQFSSCTPAITRVEVSPDSATTNIGGQQQLTARAFDSSGNQVPGVIFFWESSNTSVATIDQSGLATGVSAGTTEIQATGRSVQSDPAMLTVLQPPPVLTSVTVSPAAATIGVGETQQYTAQAKDQFGQELGGVTITFASNDTTVATVDSVNTTSNTGFAMAIVAGRANGSAEIKASANNGSTLVTSSAATLEVEPGAGQLLISEFRTRGSAGASDEFVEIYNPTTSTLSIGKLRIRASNSVGTISDRVTITAGTTLGPGCHYLLANGSGSGYSGSIPVDQTYGTGISDDGGVAITGSNGATIIDAVGMSSGSSFKEGAPLSPLSGTSDQSYERKPGGRLGNGLDMNNNAGDFALTTPGNPQNAASECLDTTAADLAITKKDSPDPVITGSDITYTITVTNNGVADSQNVTITDNLPAEVSFVSCNATGGGICGGSGNNRTVTYPSLVSGASATITLVGTANSAAGTTITNTVTVNSVTPDLNAGNNTSTESTAVEAPMPSLTITDVSANERDSGQTTFTFTISLSSPATGSGVTFAISTHDNTATTADGDYVSKTLTNQTITAGNSSNTFEVTVNGDTLVEKDEALSVNVTNVVGATVSDGIGLGTIQNDDAANLVISQLYGGGGNTGAQFTHDFIEILNRGTTTVNLSGWSVQYLGATGTGNWSVTNLSGTIQPGQYYLVQENSGGVSGSPLPAPDATGTIAMASTAGKVALVSNATQLTGSCPIGASIFDLVGYGSNATCFEGSGPAPVPSAITADFRKAGGCTDTNHNAADFIVHAPGPRNNSSPINNCVPGTPPELTINDVTVTEGNAGTTVAVFTVNLSAPAPSTDITFDIATADGTAQDNNPGASEDNDYVARTLTNQTIPAGQQIHSFSVSVNGDAVVEPSETFLINVSNVSGAMVTDGQAVGTIQNDDLPTISINDVSQNEGDGGTTRFLFTVSLSSAAPTGGVTFDIATQEHTATFGDHDYVARTLNSQTIPAGSSTYNFDVTVNGDVNIEVSEIFFVNLTNASGGTVADGEGHGTILNDDNPTLSISDVSQGEGNTGTSTLTFTVTSSHPAPTDGITFDIATADGTAQDDTPSGEDNDYVARSLTGQTITAGNTSCIFDVTVNGDTQVESTETFFVNVANVSNATVSDGKGQGMIQNDDAANLLISQVFAGGGNTGAPYTHDFVEIFNHGTTTLNFAATPYSVQYAGATSSFGSSKVDLNAGTVAPGQYFLVQLSSSGPNGVALARPDATGSIAMAATVGKVALVAGRTALIGSGCPSDMTVADFVGYGTTADCFEGSGRASAPSNTTGVLRKAGGCTDTNDNAADFLVSPPFPRNTGSALNNCVAGTSPTLTINDVTVIEADAGTTTAAFTLSLSTPAPSIDITFDISTQDNTAKTTNSDYVAKTLTNQTLPAGQQAYAFTVTINGDAAIENDETFFVNVTNVRGAMVTDSQSQGTIQNDDLPGLTIDDVSSSEGDGGTKLFTFTVGLSGPAPAPVIFDIATADDAAHDGNPADSEDDDYVGQTLAGQTIPAGLQTYTFDVAVNGDSVIELDESFFVNVTNVSGANVEDGQGQGTILNDDSPKLSIDDVSQNEGDSGTTNFTFNVTSTLPAPAGGITFDIATADDMAQDDEPASEDNDYVSKVLTSQTIPFNQTSYTFSITVNGDTFVELDETFYVNISNASNASISDSQGVGTIQNDDTANLVISQVYGGGGNSGASLTHDFIEVLNRGTTTVNLAGWSVQYNGAADIDSWALTPLCASGPCWIAPGHYFLVQQASGAGGTTPLPTPDVSGTTNLAAASGKVALLSHTTALAGACPADPLIADLVGYGGTATCFEGTAPARAPGNTTATFRKAGGCTDTNDSASDFFVHAPAPRNTSWPINNCVAGPQSNLAIDDVNVIEGNGGTTTLTFTVSLSAPAPSTDITFDIATADGTAQDDNPAASEDHDYLTKALTGQMIPAGQQTYSFTVNVNGDTVIEPTETFFVNLTNVSGAIATDGQAVGTIQNDDLPTLTVNDVTLIEGNGGTTLFTFTVDLSTNAPAPVMFDVATADSTAHDHDPAANEDNDYVARTEKAQTIPAGQASYTFEVTVNGDLSIEESETFFVNVTNVSGAIVGDGQGVGTIQNDDSPSLTINDVIASEGDAGMNTFTFTVTSSLPAPAGGITFDIATADDTAQDEDNDFVAKSLTTQMIPANQTTYTFDVTVNGDLLVERDETFFINVTNVLGATVSDGQGQGTIQNDDTPLVVISQIYGAGGNSGAIYQNDFIEVFNRGTTTVDLSGWSIQYIGAASTGTWSATNLSGILVPGQYYLIQETTSGPNGSPLPTPDATGTIAMAAATGKVALVNVATSLTGGCPSGDNILDLVGYGTTASCFEGPGSAPAPGATAADFRKNGGCTDTNINATDFLVAAPGPRNTASPLNDCNAPPNLSIDNVTVSEGNGGPVVANFTVSLSAPAPAGGVTFDIGTQNDSATTEDNDYDPNTLTAQTIASGDQTYSFAVTVNGDVNVEPNETFLVNVTNISGATVVDDQGVATIQNDDSAPLPDLSIDDVSLSEGDSVSTTFSFTVSLSAPAPADGVTFDIATADGTALDDNPATENNDYVAQNLTTQTIIAGNTSYTFNVTVNGDRLVEPNEIFFVNITNVSNANGSDSQGQGTIQNDDTPLLVISQVYGGGGNAGATYTNDFVEIFNRGTTSIDFSITPYSVQYAGATSNFTTNKTSITSGVLLSGHYFLIQEAGGVNGVALPTADTTGTINLAATAGKVALVIGTTSLTGSGCPLAVAIADFLGYGNSANCFETAPIAVSGSNPNARSVVRTASCTDTNNNSTDFSNPTAAPNARNSATTPISCP
jgi:uncharacterized repeat protein (TIGR01451 family)